MKVFKYTSVDSAIKIVKSGSVLLNNPKDFNDPFDCEIQIDENNNKKTFDLVVNYYAFKAVSDLIQGKGLKLTKSQKLLFLFVGLELKLYKKVLGKTKTYEPQPFFNAFINKVSKNNPTVRNAIEESKGKYSNELVDKVTSIKDKALVSCFSKRNDSVLMWSHYADSHHGVCIEFDEEKREEFSEVSYSKEKTHFDLYSVVSRILAYDYFKEDVDLSDKSFNKMIMAPFFTKSTDWSYEEEIRCVYSSSQLNDDVTSDMERYFLKMPKIKRIYIGCKAGGVNLDDLFVRCQHREIEVVFMKESAESFSMVVDKDKKYSVTPKTEVKRNCLEDLMTETREALDSNCYVAALSLALTVPYVCGRIYKPNLSDKERYIAWFQDYIGMYEHDVEQSEDKYPYPSGDLIFALEQTIHKSGNASIEGDYCDFKLDDFKLIIEQKRPFDSLYTGESGTETDINGNVKYTLQINIRDFCSKIIWLAEHFDKDNKEELDKLPRIVTRDFDKDLDDMCECGVINERLNSKK